MAACAGALALVMGTAALAQDSIQLADLPENQLQEILPEAQSFRQVPNQPFWSGHNAEGELVGWVVLSTDVVSIKGYSGKPLVTLVGLDAKGVISGAKIIKHSEPIILLGIPQEEIDKFVDFYTDKKADANITVGISEGDSIAVDGVSGATVTILAENSTILDTARALGAAVGILEQQETLPGGFVESSEDWSYAKMKRKKVFGHLRVTEKQMGMNNSDDAFVDLIYTIADAPQIGRPLLGKGTYKHLMSELKEGEHLIVIMGNGSGSFKGSGFVRGGIFDRVYLKQKLNTCMFKDLDYTNVPRFAVADAPSFKEGAVFISRGAEIDPGRRFELVFLGSFYDKKSAYSREFHSFSSTHKLPKSIYKIEGIDPDSLIWRQAWAMQKWEVVILCVVWLAVLALFIQRKWLTGSVKRLGWIQLTVLTTSFVVLGLCLSAQPSITQILTLSGALVGEWDGNLFLTQPLLFVSWIFIAIVLLIWGRGIFCGWICPFGSMSELLNHLGQKLKIPQFELPEKWHKVMRYLRYLIFLGLVPAFLYSPELGEKLAEIEPFKTTFFLVPWQRHWGFFIYWLVLVVISLFWFRPFCRYLCPLGAALALPSFFRISGPKRRSFCSSCNICGDICEPKAIDSKGKIDPMECMNCMHCEANYSSDKICPPLIGLKKLDLGADNPKRRKRLEEQRKRI
ncbi:MAG: 4Fe-4S binding protein [Verrucomicrobiae bacterium]|nr:4Fe-4S binding protein [Verrucomicrobiae bacterium]NNJ41812.1 4Fe-4S binding protein [Akkermansiaceae bacterium]